jgi:hypothetical protein
MSSGSPPVNSSGYFLLDGIHSFDPKSLRFQLYGEVPNVTCEAGKFLRGNHPKPAFRLNKNCRTPTSCTSLPRLHLVSLCESFFHLPTHGSPPQAIPLFGFGDTASTPQPLICASTIVIAPQKFVRLRSNMPLACTSLISRASAGLLFAVGAIEPFNSLTFLCLISRRLGGVANMEGQLA